MFVVIIDVLDGDLLTLVHVFCFDVFGCFCNICIECFLSITFIFVGHLLTLHYKFIPDSFIVPGDDYESIFGELSKLTAKPLLIYCLVVA